MNIVAIIGAVIAFSAIILGNSLEGGTIAALLNAPAFIIVVGGTFGAIILQTPWERIRRATKMLYWMVSPPSIIESNEISRLAEWSKISRREGLLGLEKIAERISDPFHKKGLALVIDGVDPSSLRRLLENDSRAKTDHDMSAAAVFRSMGGYAPTIGILGAVIGLIQVMGNLADPEQLGEGIATAFVATIYGVGFANLLFLPVADRLKALVLKNSEVDDLFIEGLMAIAEGEHPSNIQMRLDGLLES